MVSDGFVVIAVSIFCDPRVRPPPPWGRLVRTPRGRARPPSSWISRTASWPSRTPSTTGAERPSIHSTMCDDISASLFFFDVTHFITFLQIPPRTIGRPLVTHIPPPPPSPNPLVPAAAWRRAPRWPTTGPPLPISIPCFFFTSSPESCRVAKSSWARSTNWGEHNLPSGAFFFHPHGRGRVGLVGVFRAGTLYRGVQNCPHQGKAFIFQVHFLVDICNRKKKTNPKGF